jgi:hypothetical protein
MNCEDFNNIIDEIAEGKPMQVETREAGVSHVALCADCASKLANARNVSTSLRLAARAEGEEAPLQIKQNLLAAFAAQHQAATVPARVVDISTRRKLYWWSTAAAAAAAAVVLLAVTLPSLRKQPAPIAQQPFVETTVPKSGNSAVRSNAPQPPTPITTAGSSRPVKARPNKPYSARATRNEGINRSYKSEMIAQNNGEYLPLTYMSRASAMDSGTVVRVELSRSALASLGLPLNFEGSGDSIRAEVVIGDDGVARAIRLVQ